MMYSKDIRIKERATRNKQKNKQTAQEQQDAELHENPDLLFGSIQFKVPVTTSNDWCD